MTSEILRFFIDHGVIHDRVTGKHVTTDGQPPFEDSLEQVLELLNGLAGVAQSSQEPAWSASTHDEIIKRLMARVGMPNSTSLYVAFKQFANELHALAHAAPQPAGNAYSAKEPYAWAVEREGDPTFPRVCWTKEVADALVNYVNVAPPATMRALYTSSLSSTDRGGK